MLHIRHQRVARRQNNALHRTSPIPPHTPHNPRFALGVTGVMLPELDLPEQLELCHELGLTHYSLRPRYIPEQARGEAYTPWRNHRFDLTPPKLLEQAKSLRKQFDDAGVIPFGTVPQARIDNADDQLKEHLDGAAAIGAGRVRINPAPPPGEPFDYPALLDQVVRRYGQLVELARPRGVKLVIETHARSLAASPALAWNIVRHFEPEQVGVIFDMANFAREGFVQPRLAVAVLQRYIDHVHIGGNRRVTTGYDPLGFRLHAHEHCPLSDTDLNVPHWLRTLHEARVHVPLIIEEYAQPIPGPRRLTHAARLLHDTLDKLHAEHEAGG